MVKAPNIAYLSLLTSVGYNKKETKLKKCAQPNKIIIINYLYRVKIEKNISSISCKNSEYDQEIPQSQTTDNPMAPRGRAAQPSRDTMRQIKQSNQFSLLHQDDCNTRMDIKKRTTKHRTITDSHNGSNNKQKVNNNRTTALERTAA